MAQYAGDRRRILFVCMAGSIHTARWLEMVAFTNCEIAIFPVYRGAPHQLIRNATLYYPRAGSEIPGELSELHESIKLNLIKTTLQNVGGEAALSARKMEIGVSGQTAPYLFGPAMLLEAIRDYKPDLIHSLEFQHAGYLVQMARAMAGSEQFPRWLATNWGSDIYYYRNFERHRNQIVDLLNTVDLYSCECSRDVGLARELGYKGPVLPVFPNTGGFDIQAVAELRGRALPSTRKKIMIKGYQHFAGRALTSLAVLEKLSDQLKDYEIVLYSIGEAPYQRARDLSARGVLNFKLVGYAGHDEMLQMFSAARIYMGISISDAISTSVLESMATGCFPIQTDTSCCEEWFDDGRGGFIVPANDFGLICDRFATALSDDELVDQASQVNWSVVTTRLDKNIIQQQVGTFYEQVFGR